MATKEQARLYYQKNKEAIKTHKREFYQAHKEYWHRWYLEYYANNKDEINARNRKHYSENKQKINERYREFRKNYRRRHVIGYHDKPAIYGLTKSQYPEDNLCTKCGVNRKLAYHHFNDKNPSEGIWVCLPCHRKIHKLTN